APGATDPDPLQAGFRMPDPEYYATCKPEMATLRPSYQKYIAGLLRLAGMSDAVGRAERIAALEKKMAAVHADIVTSENVHKANNPATIADLKSKAPGLDWDAYLSAAGLDKPPIFIIWQPDAIKGLSALVGSESLDTWKEWLAFHTISRYAAF